MPEQILPPHAPAELGPELGLERAERDVPVRAAVRPVAHEPAGEPELAAPRNAAIGEHLAGEHRQKRQRSVEHRAVDELALPGARAVL